MSNCNSKEEYKDLSDNMRHYGNMRFAQLTILIAITFGLLALIFKSDPPLKEGTTLALKIVGIVIAFLFFIMEERAADYWHHFRKRAVKLEKDLGYDQYTNRPTRRFRTATNASRGIHGLIMIFWIFTLICPCAF